MALQLNIFNQVTNWPYSDISFTNLLMPLSLLQDVKDFIIMISTSLSSLVVTISISPVSSLT